MSLKFINSNEKWKKKTKINRNRKKIESILLSQQSKNIELTILNQKKTTRFDLIQKNKRERGENSFNDFEDEF